MIRQVSGLERFYLAIIGTTTNLVSHTGVLASIVVRFSTPQTVLFSAIEEAQSLVSLVIGLYKLTGACVWCVIWVSLGVAGGWYWVSAGIDR